MPVLKVTASERGGRFEYRHAPTRATDMPSAVPICSYGRGWRRGGLGETRLWAPSDRCGSSEFAVGMLRDIGKKTSSARRVRACRRRRRLHRALATAHDAAGLRKRSASHAAGLARPRRCRFFFVPLRRVSPRLRSGPSGRSPSACSAESPKNRFFAPARPRQAALLSSVRRRPARSSTITTYRHRRRHVRCAGMGVPVLKRTASERRSF